MSLNDLDIVYLLKESKQNEELRYSLRSVSKNLPHRNICFVGGNPSMFSPDIHIHLKQEKKTKWENTSLLLRCVCNDDRISDNFILFNDDFFVLNSVDNIPYYIDGNLGKRIYNIETKYRRKTSYSIKLRETKDMLETLEMPTVNYAVHFPMIMNKHEMLDTFNQFPEGLMWRSLYGNHHKKPATYIPDCKIYDFTSTPSENQTFVSTKDSSFDKGAVGEFIRHRFPESCRYERDV